MSKKAKKPSKLTKQEREFDEEQRASLQAEREQLAGIVASVMRGVRQDKDVKQAQMGYLLGRSADSVSNMESGRTDVALVDAIMLARRLDMDPAEVFERVMFFVRKFYGSQSTAAAGRKIGGTVR